MKEKMAACEGSHFLVVRCVRYFNKNCRKLSLTDFHRASDIRLLIVTRAQSERMNAENEVSGLQPRAFMSVVRQVTISLSEAVWLGSMGHYTGRFAPSVWC